MSKFIKPYWFDSSLNVNTFLGLITQQNAPLVLLPIIDKLNQLVKIIWQGQVTTAPPKKYLDLDANPQPFDVRRKHSTDMTFVHMLKDFSFLSANE